MYLLQLKYFNKQGLFLGSRQVYSPGVISSALVSYLRDLQHPTCCGMQPSLLYAQPERGDPVVVVLEDTNESKSLRRRFF